LSRVRHRSSSVAAGFTYRHNGTADPNPNTDADSISDADADADADADTIVCASSRFPGRGRHVAEWTHRSLLDRALVFPLDIMCIGDWLPLVCDGSESRLSIC